MDIREDAITFDKGWEKYMCLQPTITVLVLSALMGGLPALAKPNISDLANKCAVGKKAARSRAGALSFVGGLWFFDGGESTEVEKGTRLIDVSFGNYHPAASAVTI